MDSLLDVKYNRNGTKEFLVKWIGYPKSQVFCMRKLLLSFFHSGIACLIIYLSLKMKATWEPEGNLNCPEKLEAFSKKLDAVSHYFVI